MPEPEGVRVDGGIRLDKLLARVGLAESVSDAVRKIKAGAVQVNGEKVKRIAPQGFARGAADSGRQELETYRMKPPKKFSGPKKRTGPPRGDRPASPGSVPARRVAIGRTRARLVAIVPTGRVMARRGGSSE